MRVLTERLSLSEVEPTDIGNEFNEIKVAQTSRKQDEEGKGDFAIYIPRVGWVYFDLTISTNPTVHSRKRWQERRSGKIHLSFPFGVIDRADRGCFQDIKVIATKLASALEERIPSAAT